MLLAIDPVAQRLALDMRHDVVKHAARFTRIVNRDDVGVCETRDGLDFLKKSLGAERRGNILIENLDRDGAVVPWVTREVDRSHPASAKLVLYSIAVAEGGLRSGQFVGWESG